MTDSKRYVPILKWKAAEKEALQELKPAEKSLITPLLELLMPQPKQAKAGEPPKTRIPAELLAESIAIFESTSGEIAGDILKHWGDTQFFLDFKLLHAPIVSKGLENVLSTGKQVGISVIPVMHLSYDDAIQNNIISLAKKYDTELCLRLTRSDINQDSITTQIHNFLKKYELQENFIHLIVDFKITDEDYPLLVAQVNNIPNLNDWKTFAIASGAFPPDLTQFATPDLYKIPRMDWFNWLTLTNGLIRKPSFADYTIQHPIYKEPTGNVNPSASIRYTTHDKWMIMRGRGLRSPKSGGFSQYPPQAKLLSVQPEFVGANFCFGDDYIEEKGVDIHTKKTGTPRTWLRAGINRHLACTVDQIANLS
jgi:hypothetical protein